MNIVDIAAGSEDFSILVTALNTAGLTDTVRAAEPHLFCRRLIDLSYAAISDLSRAA